MIIGGTDDGGLLAGMRLRLMGVAILREACIFLREACIFLREACIFLREACIFLREACIFLREAVAFLREAGMGGMLINNKIFGGFVFYVYFCTPKFAYII